MKNFISRHKLILAIILVAAFLRLYRIYDYTEFLGDQGRDVVIISNFLKHGDLFFIGPQTSIGNMYLGPYFYYLIAPSLLLSFFNPVGPAIFIALLGVFTVYLIYRFSSKWFSPTVGYIAAFLYAISPTVIKYSNFIWNPNIMPLFALLFVYFMYKSKYIFSVLAFIMAFNSHYLALILMPLGFIIWLSNLYFSKDNRSQLLKETLLAIFIFILSLTPQILFDIKHQGQNINALVKFFTYRETTVNLKAYKSIPEIPVLFHQISSSLLSAKDSQYSLYISIIFAVGIIYVLLSLAKTPKLLLKPLNPTLIVVLWFLIGIIGLGLYKQHIYDHYFGFIFPPVIILMALVINKFGKYIGSLVFIFTVFLLLSHNHLRYSPPRQLHTTQSIINSIIEDSQGSDFNFALLAKTNYDPGYRYFLDQKKANVKLAQNQVASKLYVVCEPHPELNCNPINHPEWAIAAFGWAQLDKTWQVNNINIYALSHLETNKK